MAIDPLTPLDCDLRDFPFMPLDVTRLRDSDLAALEPPEACWAAVLLWCASWHQIPAASLPDDDKVLSNLAGFGRVVKEWMKVRGGALRGWVKCSDGRLYHSVIAEKALAAWKSKLEQSWKTECARIKKYNQRHPEKQLPYPDFEEFLSKRHVASCPANVPPASLGTNDKCPEGQGAVVPDLSLGKPHPIERDTDIERDITTRHSSSDSTIPDSASPESPVKEFKPTAAGLACKAIREAGISDGNPHHPTLTALLEAGANEDEFREAAKLAVASGKPKFAYVLGIVKGQREDAAGLKLGASSKPGKFDPVAYVNQQNGGAGHGRVIDQS